MGAISADNIFKCIFLNKNLILIHISLKFVPKGSINNNPWLGADHKPLSEAMMVKFMDAYMRLSASRSLKSVLVYLR